MKKVKGTYYKALDHKGYGELSLRRNETFEEAIESINEAVEGAKKRGYENDEKWVIAKVEWESIRTDEGMPVKSWKEETSVAFYDNGKVTEITTESNSTERV